MLPCVISAAFPSRRLRVREGAADAAFAGIPPPPYVGSGRPKAARMRY